MKELPKKWCITTTKESNDVLCDWYLKYNNSKYLDRSIGNHFCMDGKTLTGWMYHAPERKNGYTEISFEDFQRLVLGINVEKVYELW